MKWLLGTLVCISSLLQAAQQSGKEEPPYDADLFRRDASVFSIHGSFLYWRVQEGALDYALKMEQSGPDSSSLAQGKFHKATFNGEPGFRVALSYFRAPNYWEIWGQYTRLTANGTNSVARPEDADLLLQGTWPTIVSSSDNPLTEADSSIHMNYNVAELLVDRYFNPNPHLRVRMLGGGVVSWINQNWKVRYTSENGDSSVLRNHWKFVGGGLKIGTMIDWFCGFDIYLTASASCATLLGSYHNSTKQTASTDDFNWRNTNSHDVRPAFTVQGIFGPSWQRNFSCSRMEIFAGYEINTWFNLQEQYITTGPGTPGNPVQAWVNAGLIALQGLTARVTLDF